MKILGIIGGLGPMATAYFLQLITQMTDADTDQEHIEVLIHSKPSIPDRTGFILGQSARNPLPEMSAVGKSLATQGAEIIAIPCITAHYFQHELENEIGIPIINALTETALYLQEKNIYKVGIMATDGTIQSKIFQNTLQAYGLEAYIPSQQNQQKVMHLIYNNIKSGQPIELPLFYEISEDLFSQGAEVILLGCTELSLVKSCTKLPAGYLDVTEVLARKAVLSCGKLYNKYNELIT